MSVWYLYSALVCLFLLLVFFFFRLGLMQYNLSADRWLGNSVYFTALVMVRTSDCFSQPQHRKDRHGHHLSNCITGYIDDIFPDSWNTFFVICCNIIWHIKWYHLHLRDLSKLVKIFDWNIKYSVYMDTWYMDGTKDAINRNAPNLDFFNGF